MVNGWLLAGVASIILCAVVLWYARVTGGPDRPERPVLPAHYSSLLNIDPSRYPGLCSACGTENTPGYNFCKECGERLPGGTERPERRDVAKIFEE